MTAPKTDGQVQRQLVQEFIESVTEFGTLNLRLVSCIPTPGSSVHPTLQTAPSSRACADLLPLSSTEICHNFCKICSLGSCRAVAFPAQLLHEQHSVWELGLQCSVLCSTRCRINPLTLNIPSLHAPAEAGCSPPDLSTWGIFLLFFFSYFETP